MSEKVVSLRTGTEILTPGEVNPAVVAQIEKLLVAAQSGEIQWPTAVIVYGDGAVGADWAVGLPVTYQLVGRMLQVTNHFAEQASNRG